MSIGSTPSVWRLPEPCRCRPSAGFTLIEILVAVAVLGIVVLAALGGLSTVRGTAAAIETRLDRVNNAPVLLHRLRRDLESLVVVPEEAYRPPDMADDPDPYRFFCDRKADDPPGCPRLEFAAGLHLALSDEALPGDGRWISRIAYFVRSTDEERVVLRTSVPDLRHEFVQTPSAAVICRRVRRLAYAFEDAEGNEREGWDSDDRDLDFATPRAVIVRLEMADGTRHAVRIALAVGRPPRR